MAITFEITRDTEIIFGIKTIGGSCIWFNSRDARDIAYLEMQNH